MTVFKSQKSFCSAQAWGKSSILVLFQQVHPSVAASARATTLQRGRQQRGQGSLEPCCFLLVCHQVFTQATRALCASIPSLSMKITDIYLPLQSA